LQTVALSPFKGDQSYVLFEDGKAYWKPPEHEIGRVERGNDSCRIM
jgi:hypothetical protein